jgi:endonuclease/exonuclease/phosphatase (EEP) superfamily protein YafD
MNPLWLAGIAVMLLNLPFGYWRARVRKFSLAWFLAVHLPVPLVIAIRFLLRLGFHPVTYPVLVGAFFAGQFLGGKIAKLK